MSVGRPLGISGTCIEMRFPVVRVEWPIRVLGLMGVARSPDMVGMSGDTRGLAIGVAWRAVSGIVSIEVSAGVRVFSAAIGVRDVGLWVAGVGIIVLGRRFARRVGRQ